MTMPKIAYAQTNELVWLGARLDAEAVLLHCQKPRIMPGPRSGFHGNYVKGVDRHIVILLEKDFSLQKIFQNVYDFDAKVLSPMLGVFWVPCNYLLTLEEYNQHLLDSQEKEKKAKKNKKKSATE